MTLKGVLPAAGEPGLELLVEVTSSLSGDGAKEQGSGSRVSVTSSTCGGHDVTNLNGSF